MSDKGIFSAVRCYNVKTIQALASAREHAFRRDENSQQRVDASRTHLNMFTSDYGEDGRDVVDCFKKFKAETGIKEQKSASVALHLLCIVSPEWLQETGDPRDPQNPRVRELFRQSQKWAEEKFGPGSVIASRMDMDEAGSGVVDVFVCPSSVVKQKNRDDRHVISTRKALKQIQREYGRPRSFMALQDSFAEFCQANLDPEIQRGIPKETTQREHVHADIYRPAQEQAREILRDAEEQKTQIHEDAKTEAIEDFEGSSWVNRVAVSAKAKEKKQYEKGKTEGKSETAKKAHKSIDTWKEQNTRQKETIKKLREEKNELSESLKKERERSADISEPLRRLKRNNEAMQSAQEQQWERMALNGINPVPYIKIYLTLDDVLDTARKSSNELMKSYSEEFGGKSLGISFNR